jgi:hypothetical protein
MMKIVANATMDSLDQAEAGFGLDWINVAGAISMCYCVKSTHNKYRGEERYIQSPVISANVLIVKALCIYGEHASVRKVDSLKIGSSLRSATRDR